MPFFFQNAKSENEIMDAICVVSGTEAESSYNKTIAIQVII